MTYSRIVGTGSYLPKQVVTNAVTLRGNRPDADKVAPALLDYMTNLSTCGTGRNGN